MLEAISVLGKYIAQLLTGGGLMAALWLVDRLTRIKIKPLGYGLGVLGIILWAALASYRDEHRNARLLAEEKSEVWTKFNQCDKERAVGQEAMNILGSQLAQRDGLLSNQQDTFNKCILALGLKSIPQEPRLDVQWGVVGQQADAKGTVISHTVFFVVQTNKPIASVRHKLVYPFTFTFRAAALSQKELLSFTYENGQDSDNQASFSVQREWLPGESLVAITTIPHESMDRVGSCTVSPKR